MDTSSTKAHLISPLKLELGDILDMIQCGADMAKEEALKDASRKWKAARVQNEEHRKQHCLDIVLEAFALGSLEVSVRV